MNNLKSSRNLARRPRAVCFHARRGVASARSRILFLLAGLLASVTPLRADNPPTYVFQWGGYGGGNGQFEYPDGIAVDSSNNVYVVDEDNDRVEKFDGNGNYLTQWGSQGSGNGHFAHPYGVAVDSSNNVYVADPGNNRIEKFSSSGTYLAQWGSPGANNGQFDAPVGIAVDRSNDVYVADYNNSRIEKFSSNGNYLTQWGSQGSGNGQFAGPYGVAVDSSNNVYVADDENNRIQKFNSSGAYLTQWGSGGSGNSQFEYPVGIAVDSSNNVYVADSGNSRIEKFNSSGAYLTQWGSGGSGNGQFEYPYGIAVDSTGNYIYVVDFENFRIEVFVNNPNVVPPIITQQPTDQTVVAGINVIFSAGVVGTAPFSYQWHSNNVAVPGATNATLTLTNVNLSASNSTYSVLVTNDFGSELSSNAVLTILPSLVTTQPASDRSATGAALNGEVTVGPDETVVWFEWGTDTNYGNITGTTLVPGNNGSNNISAPLNGLPGNFYHYRLDATNDFGIVYGNDQSFTVGFAPSATTLPSTNGANGATLEAAVNPEGWDTTVYFRWGTPTLTNATPATDIGAGATSLNVSNFVSGLAPSTSYQYQVVASNALGTAFGKAFGDAVPVGDSFHYLFSGSERNITLPPGTYIITAYGAPGGVSLNTGAKGGLGAEMSAEFNFLTSTTLTLLVGGRGDNYRAIRYSHGYYGGGGGGGGSFVVEGSTPLVIAGGGGGAGDYYGIVGNGNVNTNGSAGGGGVSGYSYSADGGAGGTGGGGGGIGIGMGVVYGGYGVDYIYGGGGGGGFLGNGERPDSVPYSGGYSFENGGFGGGGGGYYAFGGYGGGGAGGEGAPGGGGGYSGGGGGGYYGQYEDGYGGGGGSIIDSSAIAILTEVSGIASPDDPTNGEIIITAVPPPPLVIITTNAAFGLTNGVFGFDVSGPSGSNVVIQASTDLHTWIPLQTNLLGSGLLYFSDSQSPANPRRFYRAQFSP